MVFAVALITGLFTYNNSEFFVFRLLSVDMTYCNDLSSSVTDASDELQYRSFSKSFDCRCPISIRRSLETESLQTILQNIIVQVFLDEFCDHLSFFRRFGTALSSSLLRMDQLTVVADTNFEIARQTSVFFTYYLDVTCNCRLRFQPRFQPPELLRVAFSSTYPKPNKKMTRRA